jgi:predicted O-methyltransferase YrrM
MNFEQICKRLNIDWQSNLEIFDNEPWVGFQEALKKKAIRTIVHDEAFLGWLIIINFKPRAFVELGAQHGHSGIVWADACRRIGAKFIAVELGDDSRNNYPATSRGTMRFLPEDSIKVWGDAEEELPKLLKEYPVDCVFHDCAHTWDHVENCVNIIIQHDKKIIQLAHDCAQHMWQPNKERPYGKVCAERPVFDKYFEKNPIYFYKVLEDKFGLGVVINKDLM